MTKFGLKSSKLTEKKTDGEQPKYFITALATELIDVLDAKELQIRKPTGKQYRARLYSLDQNVEPEVVKYGFIVLNSEASIHNVLPQKPKPNFKFSLKKWLTFQ
ncbi:hypothetical protein [Psychromonas sp. KJ10-2]|uniref:hypothetical protein n=1 Tax=Psychromonas sp. KJ10-2 TaxID=3391822 RepID=UPI0039B440AC